MKTFYVFVMLFTLVPRSVRLYKKKTPDKKTIRGGHDNRRVRLRRTNAQIIITSLLLIINISPSVYTFWYRSVYGKNIDSNIKCAVATNKEVMHCARCPAEGILQFFHYRAAVNTFDMIPRQEIVASDASREKWNYVVSRSFAWPYSVSVTGKVQIGCITGVILATNRAK